MRNDYPDTEYYNYADSYSEVNVGEKVNGEEVNVSDVVPVSGELSMVSTITPGWNVF